MSEDKKINSLDEHEIENEKGEKKEVKPAKKNKGMSKNCYNNFISRYIMYRRRIYYRKKCWKKVTSDTQKL